MNRRTVVKSTLRGGVVLLIGGVLLTRYSLDVVAQHLGNVEWLVAAPAILGLVAVHLLQVETWRRLAARITGQALPRLPAITTYFAGQALGSITPGNIGADLYRASAVRDSSGGWKGAAAPILCQRVASYAALLLLAGAFGLAYIWSVSPVLLILTLMTLGIVCAFVCILAPRLANGPRLDAIKRRFLPTHGDGSTTRSVHGWRSELALALILGLLFHAGSVALAYFLLVSLGETPPLLPALQVLVVVRVASQLPILPNGFGIQEGSLSLLLPTVGVAPEAALALAVLSRLSMLVTIALGLAAFAVGRFGNIVWPSSEQAPFQKPV